MINQTFLNGGYYRVDLNNKLSVLALNTVMYLWKNKGMKEQGNQLSDQLSWIEENLRTSEPERKFIFTCHVYFGIKFEGGLKFQWTNESNFEYRRKFLSILVRYSDKITIQIAGHDHHADLRYHRGKIPEFLLVPELNSYIELYQKWKNQPVENFIFNNILINPAITSADGTNPGFSLFDIDTEKGVVHKLHTHYLRIR
jgi:hypothetical protein